MERPGSRRADRLVGSRLADCGQRLERVGVEPRGAGGAVVRAHRAGRAHRSVEESVDPAQAADRGRAECAAAAHRAGCLAEPGAVRGAVGWARSDRSLRDHLCACWSRFVGGTIRPSRLVCARRGGQPRRDTSRDHVHDTAASAVRTPRGLAHLAAAAGEAADFRRLVPRADLYAAANATESASRACTDRRCCTSSDTASSAETTTAKGGHASPPD